MDAFFLPAMFLFQAEQAKKNILCMALFYLRISVIKRWVWSSQRRLVLFAPADEKKIVALVPTFKIK